jgi:hypothetical protein
LAIFIAFPANPQQLAAENEIEARQSANHIGEGVLACGTVAQVTGRAEVSYVNLDNSYPNQTLALVVWRSDLPAFEARFGALSTLVGKRVCGRGVIERYRNGLQMALRNPQFLQYGSSNNKR